MKASFTDHSLIRVCLSVLMLALSVGACDKGNRGPERVASDAAMHCYLFTQNRDSIKLSIRDSGGAITGALQFLFYEKDKSRGTIRGEMKGDTLVADYTFMSEGVQSSREIIFLKRGAVFLLGAGEEEDRGNGEVIQHAQSIRFDTGISLESIPDCD